MNRAERTAAHAVQWSWMPNPKAHLQSVRDAFHFKWANEAIQGTSVLDVGAYDGWLDFLLIETGYRVEGVELTPELCESARAYARAQKIDYAIHQGFFEDVAIDRHFDVVLCFETLEHISLALVPVYVAKMEAIATRRILISLPDQRHEDNAQHLWTPTFDLIRSMWGHKPAFELTYKPYLGTGIPANFLCSWSVR